MTPGLPKRIKKQKRTGKKRNKNDFRSGFHVNKPQNESGLIPAHFFYSIFSNAFQIFPAGRGAVMVMSSFVTG